MPLRVLIALVTLILVGTGLSVQAYLHAAEVYGADPPNSEANDCVPCPAETPSDEPTPDARENEALELQQRSEGTLESAASTARRPGSGWVRCPNPAAG